MGRRGVPVIMYHVAGGWAYGRALIVRGITVVLQFQGEHVHPNYYAS
jgi:hypothetical protein